MEIMKFFLAFVIQLIKLSVRNFVRKSFVLQAQLHKIEMRCKIVVKKTF